MTTALHQIADHIRRYPEGRTYQEISHALGISHSMVCKRVRKLVDHGLVDDTIWDGPRKRFVWIGPRSEPIARLTGSEEHYPQRANGTRHRGPLPGRQTKTSAGRLWSVCRIRCTLSAHGPVAWSGSNLDECPICGSELQHRHPSEIDDKVMGLRVI